MKRIAELKVGALRVPVVHKPKLKDCGTYDSTSGKPTISTGGPAGPPGSAEYATTVFHEWLHCVSELYELNLKERHVRCLEQQIAALFQDNPEFAELYFGSVST